MVAEVSGLGSVSDYHSYVNLEKRDPGMHRLGAVGEMEQELCVPGVVLGVGNGHLAGGGVGYRPPEPPGVLGTVLGRGAGIICMSSQFTMLLDLQFEALFAHQIRGLRIYLGRTALVLQRRV